MPLRASSTGCGGSHPDLVGAPEHLDGLLEPPGAPGGVRLLQQRGHLAHLVDRRPAGDLGGVGGEDRADGDLGHLLRDRAGLDAGRLHALERVVQPPAVAPVVLVRAQQRPAAVHLLGHVGEVEVRRERASQLRGGLQVELRQVLEGVVLRLRTHLLDEVEELWPSARRSVSPSNEVTSRMSRRRSASGVPFLGSFTEALSRAGATPVASVRNRL